MNERLAYFLLHNFWRLCGALTGLLLGLLWACFGLEKAAVILAVTLAGYLIGKRRDERGLRPRTERKPR
jgi:uncharacterized membrane protein